MSNRRKTRIRGVNLSRDEIQKRIEQGESPPAGFTGRWGEYHFYLGRLWGGATHLVGSRKPLIL